jgi:hypothetical protein
MSKEDESFPSVSVIQQDTVDSKKVYLSFGKWFSWKAQKPKSAFIYSCSADERKYLGEVFNGKTDKHRFSASDGSYELYYPVKSESAVIVLYFSSRQRYGKIGS